MITYKWSKSSEKESPKRVWLRTNKKAYIYKAKAYSLEKKKNEPKNCKRIAIVMQCADANILDIGCNGILYGS